MFVSRFNRLLILALALAVSAAAARAQNQYIGFVYPAGGQQGSTFPVRLGGQGLNPVSGLVVSGDGVTVRLVDYFRVFNNEEMGFLGRQLAELRKAETAVGDELAARMASFEFPEPIGPDTGPNATPALLCPICGTANPVDAKACVECNEKLDKAVQVGGATPKSEPSMSVPEKGKHRLIERLEMRFAEDERNPAVRSQTELVFAEVTIAPDARPGRRELRVITRKGVSNPLPFFVGQTPEVARKPMKTMQLPVLGKEHLAQRKRPKAEEEIRVTVPCTMNGQLAAGEMNRYRFEAAKGQRLVIAVKARELVPYVPDGVPGWCQTVLRVRDAAGRELAYNDDFRSNPDPLIHFEVPDDGEYLLTINEALFRGRESFVYRITIGELPHVTGIFPLGGRAGEPVKLEMSGWNLEKATLTPPPNDAKPGVQLLAASDGKFLSNFVPFVLDTLPECIATEPNDDPARAQKVQLPVIVNGRVERPGEWDVFEVQGKAGETIVAEVMARRLGSPVDTFVKITATNGAIIALNDDHFDAASGLNTDHADSYVMARLPADGTYFIHLGDTRRHGGKDFAYRLRIGTPQPDFVLRLMPSRIVMPVKGSANVTVFVMRKDGFNDPVSLNFQNLPPGFESPGATLAAGQNTVTLTLKTTLTAGMEMPTNLTVAGTAKIGEQDVVREAVPAEDRMQAFLWRHLLPADTLPVFVFDPSFQPPADRIRPPIRDADRPKDIKPTLTRQSVEWYLKQLESLYQDWLLTDDFVNREIAKTEASVIQ